jgi:phage terminase large subunit-like protein
VNKLEKMELLALLEEKQSRKHYNKISSYYPNEGPLKRDLYKKHLEFFKAGETFLERAAIAGNRTGKTTLSSYETALHLTGLYPSWWEGRRFNHPVDWWAASDTAETTRDILQKELLGPINDIGSGMIPKHLIVGEPSKRRGIADSIDTVKVLHISGGTSVLGFKSYDQGRDKFQGTKKDGIQLDEEPDVRIYTECLTRLMSTNQDQKDGLMICTFTPLKGMSSTVLMFLNESNPNRFVLTMGFDHVPHLSDISKQKLLLSFPPHERDARANGTPQLGSGAIYPVAESDILVSDFEIPAHWPRAYALDVGWNRTAGVWGALNRETDVLYLYGEHYLGQAEPVIHAQSIKARGSWIKGVIDPAARGRSQRDGGQLLQNYIDLGLDLETAFNGVESGIYEVWQRMSSGRLKVFKSLTNWQAEFRLYRRDEKGRIVKEKDHLMDTTRYLVMSGIERMSNKPTEKKAEEAYEYSIGSQSSSWMG